MQLLASDIFTQSAALLNDQGLATSGVPTLFTPAAQMAYLNMALAELRESLEQYNVQLTNSTTTTLVVLAGVVQLTQSQLPLDLISIQNLQERDNGQTSEDWQDMQRCEFLPGFTVQTTSLVYWQYANQQLNFIGATSDRQLRMEYIADKLPKIIDPSDPINLINAQSFLNYRCAALCAEFIGENQTRAETLNSSAQASLDRFLQINMKDKQVFPARRRPFLAGYRGRGYY